MEDGKINPVVGIFWQKNYDGMKDQQEVVLTPNANPLGDAESAERLKEKYLDAAKTAGQLPQNAEIIEVPLPDRTASETIDQ